MKTMPLFLAVTLLAAPALAEIKIAYVDLQRALTEVQEGQAAKTRLRTNMEAKKTQFQGEESKLRDDMSVLEKQRAMMSEETLRQKQLELQKRVMELAQKGERMQGELAEMERGELKKLIDKMDPIIKDIAEREGLTMVLERTDSGIIYAPASLDLTNELVRSYNAKYPKTAAAAAKPKK